MRRCAESATDATIPWLNEGRVGDRPSYASLIENRVDIGTLQLVKDVTEFLFLFLLHRSRSPFVDGQSRPSSVVSHTARSSCLGCELSASVLSKRNMIIAYFFMLSLILGAKIRINWELFVSLQAVLKIIV